MTWRRPPQDAVALLLQQYADALRSGLTAAEAMELVRRASSAAARCPSLADALLGVAEGRTAWPQAIEGSATGLPNEVADLLAHGEQGGQLPEALELVAQEFEQRAALRQSVSGALTWPALIAVTFGVVASVIMIFVVPAFREVFASFGAELPPATIWFITLSDFWVEQWWLLLALVLAGAWCWRHRGRLLRNHGRWTAQILRVPVLGPYLALAFLLRVARLLEPVASGRLAARPVLAYLRATSRGTLFESSAAALERAHLEGARLSEAVRASFDSSGDIALAFELDERGTGSGSALRRALQVIEDELARRLVGLEQVMVSTTYVVVGALVGGFVIAMYLPIFKLGAVL